MKDDGVALYQSDHTELHTPKPKTPKQALAMAQEYFDEWYPSSLVYLNTASGLMEHGRTKEPAFTLHRSCERLNLGMFELTPRVAFRAARIDFSEVAERGGGPALGYELGSYDSYQARAGLNFAGTQGFRPFLNAEYVHDFADRPGAFGANFAGGVGPGVVFALPGTDHDWAEVSGGIGYQAGNIGVSVTAETTIWRDDLSYQSYHGTVTFRF